MVVLEQLFYDCDKYLGGTAWRRKGDILKVSVFHGRYSLEICNCSASNGQN